MFVQNIANIEDLAVLCKLPLVECRGAGPRCRLIGNRRSVPLLSRVVAGNEMMLHSNRHGAPHPLKTTTNWRPHGAEDRAALFSHHTLMKRTHTVHVCPSGICTFRKPILCLNTPYSTHPSVSNSPCRSEPEPDKSVLTVETQLAHP